MADGPTPPTPPDVQDPLPESNWLWRRVFVFAVTAAVLWMVWGAITRLGAAALVQPRQGIPALLSLCKSLLFLTMMMVTYYMVAPSAEQIVKMMQVAGMLKRGVQFAGRSVIDNADGRSEQTQVSGIPPLPPAAPVAEANPPWETKP